MQALGDIMLIIVPENYLDSITTAIFFSFCAFVVIVPFCLCRLFFCCVFAIMLFPSNWERKLYFYSAVVFHGHHISGERETSIGTTWRDTLCMCEREKKKRHAIFSLSLSLSFYT